MRGRVAADLARDPVEATRSWDEGSGGSWRPDSAALAARFANDSVPADQYRLNARRFYRFEPEGPPCWETAARPPHLPCSCGFDYAGRMGAICQQGGTPSLEGTGPSCRLRIDDAARVVRQTREGCTERLAWCRSDDVCCEGLRCVNGACLDPASAAAALDAGTGVGPVDR
jgi:hypothetical protein